jgi:hypothetical protein
MTEPSSFRVFFDLKRYFMDLKNIGFYEQEREFLARYFDRKQPSNRNVVDDYLDCDKNVGQHPNQMQMESILRKKFMDSLNLLLTEIYQAVNSPDPKSDRRAKMYQLHKELFGNAY